MSICFDNFYRIYHSKYFLLLNFFLWLWLLLNNDWWFDHIFKCVFWLLSLSIASNSNFMLIISVCEIIKLSKCVHSFDFDRNLLVFFRICLCESSDWSIRFDLKSSKFVKFSIKRIFTTAWFNRFFFYQIFIDSSTFHLYGTYRSLSSWCKLVQSLLVLID